MTVFAGSIAEDISPGHTDAQGMVAVIASVVCTDAGRLDSDWIESSVHLTPEKAGPVTIVDAEGERLILEAGDGTQFYFDVPARQFVPSMTVRVPTATPLPTRSD